MIPVGHFQLRLFHDSVLQISVRVEGTEKYGNQSSTLSVELSACHDFPYIEYVFTFLFAYIKAL